MKYIRFFYLLGLSIIAISCNNNDKSSLKKCPCEAIYKDVEFGMPEIALPFIPDNSVNIIDFGAIGDGQVLNTKAFEKAIDSVSHVGGGTVIVPSGIWLTGPIIMKSNINLHVEEGAILLFSDDFDDYKLIETSFEGLNTFRCISPIYGKDLENISITGKGIIDGSGDTWRPVKKSKMTIQQWKKLLASGGVLNEKENIWYPSEKALNGVKLSDMNVPRGDLTKEDYEQIKDFLRPVMVSLVNCKNVLLNGPIFQNSPAWNIHPLMCENIIIKNVTIRNPWYAQNGDGLDLESCKNAIVYNCYFDVGDDAICIKSGKNKAGRLRGMPTENVIVKKCIVYHGHGGFVVGSEMSGGVKNVHVSNCTFIGTDVGLRFKSTRGRGGVVENIYISNINMMDIPTEPIRFNLYYGGNAPVPEPEQKEIDIEKLSTLIPPVTEETPQFKNISIKNIVCKGAKRAVYLQGLPEMNIKNITIENVNIEAKKGMECIDADSIFLTNCRIETIEGPVMNLKNAKNFIVKNFAYEYIGNDIINIEGVFSNNIQFDSLDFKNFNQESSIGNNVSKEVVKLN